MLKKTTSQKEFSLVKKKYIMVLHGAVLGQKSITEHETKDTLKNYLHSEFPMTGYLDNERSVTGYLDLSVN